MSFGLSPTDIENALKKILWVIDQFKSTNSADHRLAQFITDIKLLDGRLQTLKTALENAERRYEHPDMESIRFRRDLRNLVGEIQQTVNQGEQITKEQQAHQRNFRGIRHTFVWATLVQPKVDALHRTIQFQAHKIYLVMEPVTQKHLETIDGKMDEMLRMLRALNKYIGVPSALPEIQPWLDLKFKETILLNQPSEFVNFEDIPLKQGFDALHLHYMESTVAFHNPEIAEQTPEQYLNLLKSQWLLAALRKGEQFQRTGSLYPRVIEQLEQRIILEHARNITRFNDLELQQLHVTAFLIWPPEEVEDEIYITDPNDADEVILRLSPPSPFSDQNDSIDVFRTGQATLRIAHRRTDRTGTLSCETERYNIHQDIFRPFYTIVNNSQALFRSRSSPSSISIHRTNGTGATDYRLTGVKDILSLQRAITSFQVVYDKNVKWTIGYTGRLKNTKLVQGEGRLQIWDYAPFTGEETNITGVGLAKSSTGTSLASPISTINTLDSLLDTEFASMPSITAGEHSVGESTICAETRPNPVVLIFSQENDEYSCYHVELGIGMQYFPKPSPSKSDAVKPEEDRRFQRGTIEFVPKEKSCNFQTQTTVGNLVQWNLALFAQPRHPDFYNKKVVQVLDTNFWTFDFERFADKEDFRVKFNKAIFRRNNARKMSRRVTETFVYLGETNGRLGRRNNNPRAASICSATSVSNDAPLLRPISQLSAFQMDDSFAEDGK